ncbi:MAG: HD domain-containing protein [Erysipelotrichaceae bacterium]|jgi:3'-5' exoribonuclease|nr:HD domain-containing protein [Erysipelotrichaceae bacterium]
MGKQVKDFTEGEKVQSNLLISSLVKGTTNSGSPYLSLVLQDSSKSIDAKLWDVKPELEKQMEVGKVYGFDLEVINYKGKLQAKVLKVLPLPQADLNMDDFVFRSPVSKDALRENIQEGVNMINNDKLARIVTGALNYYANAVYEYPAAARIHHNFIGGLATHTSGMIKLAVALANIYPQIDRDYLLAGVIVHDLGKIDEFTSPVVTEYSPQGKLLGHISIMDARLLQIGEELGLQDSEELMVLRHMVLSHHGQFEFGSPVRPETLEAEMLNLIDNIDARVNTIDKALGEIKEGEFTPRIMALENRVFYKHK